MATVTQAATVDQIVPAYAFPDSRKFALSRECQQLLKDLSPLFSAVSSCSDSVSIIRGRIEKYNAILAEGYSACKELCPKIESAGKSFDRLLVRAKRMEDDGSKLLQRFSDTAIKIQKLASPNAQGAATTLKNMDEDLYNWYVQLLEGYRDTKNHLEKSASPFSRLHVFFAANTKEMCAKKKTFDGLVPPSAKEQLDDASTATTAAPLEKPSQSDKEVPPAAATLAFPKTEELEFYIRCQKLFQRVADLNAAAPVGPLLAQRVEAIQALGGDKEKLEQLKQKTDELKEIRSNFEQGIKSAEEAQSKLSTLMQDLEEEAKRLDRPALVATKETMTCIEPQMEVFFSNNIAEMGKQVPDLRRKKDLLAAESKKLNEQIVEAKAHLEAFDSYFREPKPGLFSKIGNGLYALGTIFSRKPAPVANKAAAPSASIMNSEASTS